MNNRISNLLLDKRLVGVDVNSTELVDIHRKILEEKPLMNKVFTHFYTHCNQLSKQYFNQEGQHIEIGAGVSFFKKVFPNVITTDIKPALGIEKVLDAQNMDLADLSVSTFYGINCFHHFPNPQLFFNELSRTLIEGGGCILIEPHYGSFASFMYKRLFATEIFDPKQESWDSSASVMNGANQALSYLVFVRDFQKWEALNPTLEIVEINVLNNYLEYLLSGGLNFRSLVPNFLLPIIEAKQWLLKPFNHYFALHNCIVIRKKKTISI